MEKHYLLANFWNVRAYVHRGLHTLRTWGPIRPEFGCLVANCFHGDFSYRHRRTGRALNHGTGV